MSAPKQPPIQDLPGWARVFDPRRPGGRPGPTGVRAAIALIGFTAVVAQIVLMRELMVVFAGNEISIGLTLASWLLWTAFGSGVLGRIGGLRRGGNAHRPFAALQVLAALTFPATIYALRASRVLFHSTPGELLGPGAMFLTSLVALGLFCALSGWLFAAGARLYAVRTGSPAAIGAGPVYLLEALGSGFGGLVASVALIRWMSAFQIASVIALLNLLAATLAFRKRRIAAIVAFAAGALMFGFVAPRLERDSLTHLWRGLDLVTSRNSVYGNLVVTGGEGSRSVYENGVNLFNAPDPAAAEEAVHYALLEHPAPRRVLLLGGGVNGSAVEVLRHPTIERVDHVELDPAIFELVQQYFPPEWAALRADPRVQIHIADGRLFVKSTSDNFDVIIVNLPDPQTAQLNRFYTREFFHEAAAKLSPGGVLALQLRASENYISPELGTFLACINRTLRDVFPEVVAIPGETVHFFAAKEQGGLTRDPQQLVTRLRERNLQTSYVREFYLPFRMTADRVADLDQQLRPRPETPINRDLAPVAYYFDVALWSGQFNAGYRRLLGAMAEISFGRVLLGSAIVLVLLASLLRRRARATAGFCVATMGFTMMALEILLLLGFQALYGYVYHQLAILIAAFMAGMAAGGWRALRNRAQQGMRTVAALQLLAAVTPLLLCGLFELFSLQRQAGLIGAVFPVLALGCGVLGGYQFPIATRVFQGSEQRISSPGTLYALDLAGACVAAVLLSAWFVPLFGFWKTAILIAVANSVPAVAGLFARRSPASA